MRKGTGIMKTPKPLLALRMVFPLAASLIVLLLWLYLCGQILFLGIVFTSVWYHRWRGVRQTVHFPRREDGERSER